ncbi:MAG: flotillin-like FloA family protein, partial [Verrucomicrobiales bacterium]|nr:flotillin-like FloA family protein [Verrucomicrobiales bacterium]
MNPILAQSSFLPGQWDFVLYAIGAVLLLVFAIIVINFGMIYIRALFSGAKVTLTELIALRLRRVPAGLIVDSRIAAVRSGLPLSIDDLSTHFMAGGNVPMVVLALIAARKAGINLIFDRACAIDLATKGTGKTVIEAVRTSINPRVI